MSVLDAVNSEHQDDISTMEAPSSPTSHVSEITSPASSRHAAESSCRGTGGRPEHHVHWPHDLEQQRPAPTMATYAHDRQSISHRMAARPAVRAQEEDDDDEDHFSDTILTKTHRESRGSLKPRSSSSSSQRKKSSGPKTVEEVREHMQRIEEKIKKAAKLELALLNQSRDIRNKRQLLTKHYEKMGRKLRELASANGEGGSVPATLQMSDLPPLYPQSAAAAGDCRSSSGVIDLTEAGRTRA